VNEEIVVERRFRHVTVLHSYLNLSRMVSCGFLEHFRMGELPVLVLSKTSKKPSGLRTRKEPMAFNMWLFGFFPRNFENSHTD
jgi:hypothetical protein